MSAVESAVAESTRNAALPVTQRAAIALQSAQTEKDLKELAEKHRDIVTVTNKDGREQAHRAYMTLKTTRVEIEKRGKQAREDATAFSKAVIAEEKRLVGLIEPEESRLQGLRDAYDTEQERIRKEAEEKERARVAAIQQEIAAIRQYVPVANGRNAESIAEYIERCRATPLTEDLFAEWLGEAQSAHAETMAELERMHAARVEQDRIEAEAAEKRRQQEERERAEREEREARERAEREAEAQRQREEAERLAAREREIEAERRRMREEQAERDRQEAERQEQLRREQEQREKEESERQARIREEEQRIALQRRELEQERACNQALAALADSVAQAERAVDASACRALLEAVDATPVTDETYGAFAQSLRAAVQAAALRIENRMIELTPPPAAAGELTSAAVPSPTASDPSAPAAGAVSPYPYPGHQAIVDAVATHHKVSAEVAHSWLMDWAESNGVAA